MIWETERILLRPWEETDAEELYRYASDPEVGLPCGFRPHADLECSRQVLTDILMKPGTYAIVWKESGLPVGSCGIFPTSAAGLRRDLVEHGFLKRDRAGTCYQVRETKPALEEFIELNT